MLKICDENRQEIENEYLALLLNKPELFTITQIKSEYLADKQNAKIFDYAKECYEENECLEIMWLHEKHKDINLEYMIWLMCDVIYFKSAWKEQLKLSEKSIVNYFKEDVIKRINMQLEKGIIDYEEFMRQMAKLNEIVLTGTSTTLDSQELKDGINDEKHKINLNKFPKLNKMLSLVQGDFVIIGAKTGAGKSGFMLNLMNDLRNAFQCIYFNMEMSRSTIYQRLVSIAADIPMNDVANPKSSYQKETVEKTIQEIEKSNLIVEHKATDIQQIKSIVAKLKDKNKHTVLFIDHLGLTKSDNTKSLYEQATEVAKALRQMCLEYDCTVISASQLNRTAYSSDKVSLSMLKDSGELENSASKVILLTQDNEKDKNLVTQMTINVAKNRDGICGNIAMKYDKAKQVFEEINNYGVSE